MSALSHATQPDTVRSGRYLDATLRSAAKGHMSQRKLNDPAALEFFSEMASRIVEARARRGWRTEDLAAALGLGYSRTQQIERGMISMNQVTAIAEALGVEPHWLLHGAPLREQIGALVEAQLALEKGVRDLLRVDDSSSTGS